MLRNEWFIRSFAEWQNYTKHNGKVLFITLTYNNVNLPRYTHFSFAKHLSVDPLTSCFNKDHLDKFISNLTSYLHRKYKSGSGVKYLHCCEYGKRTKRPHYHCLLFLPWWVATNPLHEIKEMIRKAWPYGFVGYTPAYRGGAIVRNMTAIRYVSKYVTKDLSYYELPEVQKAIDEMDEFRHAYPGTPEKEVYNLFNKTLPRHYQSQKFGYEVLQRKLCEVDDLGNFQISDGYLDVLQNGVKLDDGKYYPMPRYVLNRLCYDTRKDGVRYLNKAGKFFIRTLAFIRCEERAKELDEFFSAEGLSRYIGIRELKYLAIPPTLSEYIRKALKLRRKTFYDLAIYELFFKDVIATDCRSSGITQRMVSRDAVSCAEKLLDIQASRDKDKRSSKEHHKSYLHNVSRDIRMDTFNKLKCFEHFDDILSLERHLVELYNRRKYESKEKLQTKVKETRDLIFNLIYHVPQEETS